MALRRQDFDNNEEQSSKTTKRPRITIDVTPELRRRIKIAASQKDQSISEYVGKILDEVVPDPTKMIQERHPATRKMLDELMQVRDQLLQERNGQPFEDSVELIRQMREERSRELEQL